MTDTTQGSGQVLPTGTVTFLFTDIEGSTKLWEKYPDGMKSALVRHDEILRAAIEAHGGYVFKTVGDAFCAAFGTAPDALEATLEAQRALSTEEWGETGPLKVRASLHTGAAEERDGDYYGPPVNRVARLLSAGHGGQVILSQPTYDLVRDELPEGVSLSDMGEHRLKDLARPEQVFQVVFPDLAADFAPLKTLDTRPNNLPVQPTPFIGREKELEAVSRLLAQEDVRLLTLIGPGGTGKTRLGLQIAADLIEDFEEGVFFVSLDSISDPDLVSSTIAHTLGLQEIGGQSIVESTKNYLRDKEILLLLDNFEQVVPAAPFVSDLLAACSKLKVLVTSREVLHLSGEQSFPVPPLTLPEGKAQDSSGEDFVATLTQYEAVRLFIERARSVKPDFEVTSENAPAVAEICHRLDGLPLAIELAIARIRLLTPQKMLERLVNKLPLLTKGARDLPERQQTLQGAIAWSHDLLEESEKVLFRRLSVFSGGCSLEAAEEVCNTEADLEIDVLDGIGSLVDKSLLRQEEVEGEARFVMLGTVREYGLERMSESGEEEALRRYHANFFLSLTEEEELRKLDEVVRLDRMEVENNNIRAMLEWTLESGEVEEGLRSAVVLIEFWTGRGYISEGLEWLEKLLAASLLLEGSEESGVSTSVRARGLHMAGYLVWIMGDYVRAKLLLEEGLTLFRKEKDKKGIAGSLIYLGFLSLLQGDYGGAEVLSQEGLSIRRELGYKPEIQTALRLLGQVEENQGNYSRATAHFEESLALGRELGSQFGMAFSLSGLGRVAYLQGDYGKAAVMFEESLSLFQELGNKPGSAGLLEGIAMVAVTQEQPEKASRLFGAGEALREAIGSIRFPFEQSKYDLSVAAARAELEEEAFEAAWAEGRVMSMEAAIEYALKVEDA